MLRHASISWTLAALGLLLAAEPAPAQPTPDARTAVGLHAGSAGVGPDLTFRWTERTHVRITGGAYSYDTEIDTDDLTYDTEADLRTAFLLLDWYPGAGGFRVSVGGGWNGTEAEVSAPAIDLLRNELPELPAELSDLGRVTGTAGGQEVVAGLLVGWGNPFRGGAWNVSFEIGAFYQGEPEVDLSYRPADELDLSGIVQGLVQSYLEAEEAELEKELEDYRIVPLVSLGVSYRF